MTTGYAWNLPFGAQPLDNGAVSFRLWAPAQHAVALVLEGDKTLPMHRRSDGWFEVTAACALGTRYCYRLDDGMRVPDPASRGQWADVHGPSVVVDPRAYHWRNKGWRGRPWRETVLYELHVGICGGFSGVMRELPRIAALGVTAVELMPINDFPGCRNWGYDGALPYAPDRAYGTPDELKALIDTAHDHGLMIFLDVVYNHFGPDGNYLSCYAPQFFRNDMRTPWGPAIEFRRSEVRNYFTQNALYWLMEYRFDGLRFDAVHAITEQDWVDEMARTVRQTLEPSRHAHLVLEHHNDASHLARDCDAQWNDDGHNALHVLLTGEDGGYYADYDRPAEQLARCLAEGFAFQGEVSRYQGEPRGTPSAHLPPTAFVLFLQNHDQIGNRAFGERLTVLADPQALEAAIALQLLCPQIPLLFMGEETASRTPFLFFTDHSAELACAVREGRRADFARFQEFADPAQRERIPDPNAAGTFEASEPRPDAAAAETRQSLYRRLLALRHETIVPRLAGARAIEAHAIGHKAVLARWRLGDDSVLTIATNLGETSVPLARPSGSLMFGRQIDNTLPARCTSAWLETAGAR